MPDVDLIAALRLAEQAAVQVAPTLKEALGAPGRIDSKSESPWDVVTRHDRETEERVTEALARFDSDIPVRGEEFGGDEAAASTWLIDPIDGTGHFVRGIPMCTTMIALIIDNEVVASCINNFGTGELFSAARGHGATLNGQPISVSARPLRASYLVTEVNLNAGNNMKHCRAIQERTAMLNVMASGYGFAMTACGRFDGRISLNSWGYDWDYAPGSLLVSEAGGTVTNVGVDTYDYRNLDVIAANPEVHRELQALLADGSEGSSN